MLNLLKGQTERMPTFMGILATKWQADTGEGYWQELNLKIPKTEFHDLVFYKPEVDNSCLSP